MGLTSFVKQLLVSNLLSFALKQRFVSSELVFVFTHLAHCPLNGKLLWPDSTHLIPCPCHVQLTNLGGSFVITAEAI